MTIEEYRAAREAFRAKALELLECGVEFTNIKNEIGRAHV